MNNEALVGGLFSFLGVVLYLLIAWRLSHRTVPPDGRIPAMQFVVFWVGLAGSAALSGILSLNAAFELPSLDLVVTFLYLEILLVTAALWGLICYLAYLYTGRERIVPISVLYAAEYALLVYYITASRPDGVSVALGSVDPTYSVTLTGPLLAAPILILVFPELIAPLFYLRLFFRTRDRVVRYRIGMVGGGLLVYFLFDFFNPGSLISAGLASVVASRLLVLLAALVVLLAYFPPRAIRLWLGIPDPVEPAPAPGGP
jgi:hypothetical protein